LIFWYVRGIAVCLLLAGLAGTALTLGAAELNGGSLEQALLLVVCGIMFAACIPWWLRLCASQQNYYRARWQLAQRIVGSQRIRFIRDDTRAVCLMAWQARWLNIPLTPRLLRLTLDVSADDGSTCQITSETFCFHAWSLPVTRLYDMATIQDSDTPFTFSMRRMSVRLFLRALFTNRKVRKFNRKTGALNVSAQDLLQLCAEWDVAKTALSS